MAKKYMGSIAVARRFGVDNRTIRRWAMVYKEFPYTMTLGGHIRFDVKVVEAWIKSKTYKPL